MKKILTILLLLFSFNVYAENNATICLYNVNGDNVSVTYYIENDKVKIGNFKVNGKSYKEYSNHLTTTFVQTNVNTDKCPSVTKLNFIGLEKPAYFITDTDEVLRNLIMSGIVYEGDDPSQVVGQLTGKNVSGKSVNNIKTELFTGKNSFKNFKDKADLLDNYVENYLNIYCTSHERSIIYDYLLENSFRNLSTFDITYKYKGNSENLSRTCINNVDKLKDEIIVVEEILDFYVNNKGDVNKMSYLYLLGSYQNAYGYLHSASYNLDDVNKELCELIGDDVKEILNLVFDTFRIVCIVLVIFLVYLDGMKTLGSKDDSKTKKWISSTIKRLIILALALMLPFIIDIILDLLNLYFSSNYVKIDGECVKTITGM